MYFWDIFPHFVWISQVSMFTTCGQKYGERAKESERDVCSMIQTVVKKTTVVYWDGIFSELLFQFIFG